MRKGSLPRSIALPPAQGETGHYPDGLDEAAVDDLLEQTDRQVDASPCRPGWLSTDATEQRRARRRVRQIVRILPAQLRPLTGSDESDGEVA